MLGTHTHTRYFIWHALCVLQIFKRVGWVATRLLLVPGIIEAFFDGGLAVAFFGMPALFAFATGFILKAVGPALVIQCMFDVQQRRLGTAKGQLYQLYHACSTPADPFVCYLNFNV